MTPDGDMQLDGVFSGDCPGSAPPSPPVITDGLDAAELPASSVSGATHTVAWSADADRCSYAASSFPVPVNNWPTSGDACDSAANCASPHTVAVTLPAAPGSYTFDLRCWRDGVAEPAASQRTVIVPDTSACIAPAGLTRVNNAYVEFNYAVGDGRTVDATQFENIFGYFDETTPLRPFPGVRNASPRLFLPSGTYASMRFTVPSTLAASTSGLFRFEETLPQANRMSFTISRSCGDFSETPSGPLVAACAHTNLAAGSALHWIVGSTAQGYCRLEPGETYYLNVVHASLSAPLTSYCTGSCGNTIQNTMVPGSPAWP